MYPPRIGKIGETFQVRKPGAGFVILTAGFIGLFLLLGELFFRLDVVKNALSATSIGSRHRQLEIQFARLDRLAEQQGKVDCIFLGNSMVWIDINPQVVMKVFEERTGKHIQCFNFGVSAMPASSAGKVASILVDKYHPGLLIYGTFARDYAVPTSAEDAFVISNTPWIRYWNGEFNIPGLLYENSSAYRYQEQMRYFFDLEFGEVFQDNFGPEDFRAYGLDPKMDVRMDVTQTPDPEDVGNKNAFLWLYDYKIMDEDLAGLQQIIDQSEKGVEVVVVEMPFYETGYQFFENGKQDYNRYVDQVAQMASSKGVQFWRISEQVQISADGWWDILHLNMQGTNQFSTWLGNRLSDATQQRIIQLPNLPVR